MADGKTVAPLSTTPRPGLPRRDVVVGGLVVLAAAGAGAAGALAGALRPVDGRPFPPPELTAALADERVLIARIDASVARDPALRAVLTPIRADHAAHASTLATLLARFPAPRNSPSTSPVTPPGTPAVGRADLAAAESRAATAAAQRAAALAGGVAVLLASIAACESSHAAALG